MDIKRNYLFNANKLKYVNEVNKVNKVKGLKGEKSKAGCILCAIADKSPDVELLEIYRTKRFIVASNLYPYNPGHIMIFPIKHIENLSGLSSEEAVEMHKLTVEAIAILNDEFSPSGYNVGFNLGNQSGASISHIHQHIVPRYGNEAGFIDVISGTRLFVVDPSEMTERLKKRFGGKK